MENIPQEPKLNKSVRMVTALLFICQSAYSISVAITISRSYQLLIIAIIFLIVAIGLLKKLNWSRVPGEFLLAFLAFIISGYFMPAPDARMIEPFREIAIKLNRYNFWLFHMLIWSAFLYMAYIISNSGSYFYKKWWQ